MDITIASRTDLDGVPVIFATVPGDLDYEQAKAMQAAIEERLTGTRIIMLADGITVRPADSLDALLILRTLVESFDHESVSEFAAQFDIARQFVNAMDARTTGVVGP
jgi:hypothetical protein